MRKGYAAAFAAFAVTTLLIDPAIAVRQAPARICPKPRAGYEQLAAEAYIWGYPLIRSAQLRQNMTLPEEPLRPRPPSAAGAPINRIGHARELADPRTRQGVAPNNDTLYSVAWIDTAAGPFVFDTPDFGERYYTFQMGQADTSTDVALGRSTHGRQLPPIFIVGPAERAKVPHGMVAVRSSQRYLMIAGRTLVNGPADLAEAHRLQDAMRLRTWADYRAGRDAAAPITAQPIIGRADPPTADAAAFLEMLGVVLADWRPTRKDVDFVRSLSPLGLSPAGFDPHCLGSTELAAIARGLAQGRGKIEQRTRALGTNVNGWTVSYQGSQFGTDMLLRAAVAMDQIYVLPASEALYFNAKVDRAGQPLDGKRSYRLHFGKDNLPPARFFWSATMYYAKGFLVPNEIGRYSIGDRTPGLVRGTDGSIDILLQHARPDSEAAGNWLPTPVEPFMVMLRLYGPAPRARERRWSPPAIDEARPKP